MECTQHVASSLCPKNLSFYLFLTVHLWYGKEYASGNYNVLGYQMLDFTEERVNGGGCFENYCYCKRYFSYFFVIVLVYDLGGLSGGFWDTFIVHKSKQINRPKTEKKKQFFFIKLKNWKIGKWWTSPLTYQSALMGRVINFNPYNYCCLPRPGLTCFHRATTDWADPFCHLYWNGV